jgi:hypothetical protein
VTAFYRTHCGWWNWNVSARVRLVSLGSLWLLLLGSPLLGLLLLPLGAFRFAAGTAQLVLNRELGKEQPMARRTFIDWSLLGVTLLASMAVAQISEVTGSHSTLLLIPVAVPFSAIQLRLFQHSRQAFHAELPANVVEFQVIERRLAA